jgi:hypothetical protein
LLACRQEVVWTEHRAQVLSAERRVDLAGGHYAVVSDVFLGACRQDGFFRPQLRPSVSLLMHFQSGANDLGA